MSDLVYSVKIDLSTHGNLNATIGGLNSSIGRLNSNLGSIGSDFSKIGGNITGAFEGAVESAGRMAAGLAKIGTVAAIGGITYGVAKLNAEIEDTTISIGTLLHSQGIGGGNFNSALKVSADLMKQARVDAAALPGETRDLTSIMRSVAAAGLSAGLSPQGLEKFSAKLMAVGAVAQLQSEVTGREASMALGGHAITASPLARLLGVNNKEFNQATAADRLRIMQERLDRFAPALAAYSNAWSGLSSTMVDNLKRIGTAATQPLFEHLKQQLGNANSWFDEHRERLEFLANQVGWKLVDAFKSAKTAIAEWFPAIRTFAGDAYQELKSIWTSIAPIVMRVSESLRGSLADGSALHELKSILGVYGALKAGSILSGLLPTSTIATLAMGGGGGVMAEGLGAAAPGLGLSLVLLTPAMVALAGAIHNLTDASSLYHEKALATVGVIRDDLNQTLARLGDIASDIGPPFLRLADSLGDTMLTRVEAVTHLFKTMAENLQTLREKGGVLRDLVLGPIPKLNPEVFESPNREAVDISGFHPYRSDSVEAVRNLAPKITHNDNSTNHYNIQLDIASNADPSRIARMIASHIAEMKRNTKVSPFAKNLSAINP